MRIALVGYGKMGKAIEKMAISQGHKIVLKTSSKNPLTEQTERLKTADVAIDFSTPTTAFDNIMACIDAGIPVASGTTAWLAQYPKVVNHCLVNNGSFLYASNFSIGVNILFAINKQLAKLMNGYDYEPSIEEIHHKQKLDAPSGTAISLAQQAIEQLDRKTDWHLDQSADKQDFIITALREDGVPGTHTVSYDSPIDTISIHHTAHSRDGFVAGSLAAAKWLIGKKGVFSMEDVLGI